MNKQILILIIVIVILSLSILGLFLKINKVETILQANIHDNKIEIGRYQFYKANELNMVILDTTTGEMWTKYISATGGHQTWTNDTELQKVINK